MEENNFQDKVFEEAEIMNNQTDTNNFTSHQEQEKKNEDNINKVQIPQESEGVKLNSLKEDQKPNTVQYTSQEVQTEEELNNQSTPEEITQLAGKLELQEALSKGYLKENQNLQGKISSMKLGIQELHAKFEIELNKKDKVCMDKLFSFTKDNEELRKKETDYIKTICALDDVNKTLKTNISSISKEKMDLEDVIFRQEDKLSILSNRVNQIEQLLTKKNKIIKENEAYAMELIAIVEEQKKELKMNKGKNRVDVSGIYHPDSNELINQVKNLKKELEEKNKRIRLYEADTSAIYLKSNNLYQGKEVYDGSGYQNNNDITEIGIGNKSLNEGNERGGNMNTHENSYLPLIGVKNNHNAGKEKLDEFKTMMNQLIEDINE